VIYLCAIAFLLFSTGDSLPSMSRSIFGLPTDKVAHFVLFAPFPILAFLSFDKETKKVWHTLLFAVVCLILGAGLAALTEYVQTLIPSRVADVKDFYADLAALTVSSILVFLVDVSKLPIKGKKRK